MNQHLAMMAPAVMLCLLLAGCACLRGQSRGTMPEGLRVLCGTTGVQAGRAQGYTLEADGQALAWMGIVPGQGAERWGRVPEATRQALWKAIEGAGFFERAERTDVTPARFLQVATATRQHTVSWVVGPGAPPAPADLSALFEQCQNAAAEAQRAGGP